MTLYYAGVSRSSPCSDRCTRNLEFRPNYLELPVGLILSAALYLGNAPIARDILSMQLRVHFPRANEWLVIQFKGLSYCSNSGLDQSAEFLYIT